MHVEYDCPWQSASGAKSGTSLSSLEGFREFEAASMVSSVQMGLPQSLQ